MRVLLVKPGRVGTVGLDRTALVEPLGLQMVAAALPDHEIQLLDLRLAGNLEAAVKEFQPEACGISSSFTTEVYRCLDIARRVKEERPSCLLFVGGHHPSLRPEDFSVPNIDAIVVGEAETTAPELLAAHAGGRPLEEVAGLVLNCNGSQVHTAPREAVPDLDELPFPARRLVAGYQNDYYMGFQRPHALVETARGCSYRCKFCSVWQFYGGRVRSKSPERVVAELGEAPAPNIFITDDNFLNDVERAHHIADLVRESGMRKRYTFQARADTIARHRDLIAHWKDTGPTSIFVGVEAIAEDDLVALHKNSTIADNERALDVMKEVGVGFSCNFIVSPEADRDEFARLREYARKHGLRNAGYSVLTPLPGTELHEEMKDSLATRDYELFDLLHAVTPTRLPLEEFYREFAALWATSRAIGSSHRAYRLWKLIRALASGSVSLSSMRLGMNLAKMLSDPKRYFVAHRGSRERCARMGGATACSGRPD